MNSVADGNSNAVYGNGFHVFFLYRGAAARHGVFGETPRIVDILWHPRTRISINPYPTAFPYGNGMVLHFYQQQESSTTKTVHKVINKGLKTYV